jgi:hypothetical protein
MNQSPSAEVDGCSASHETECLLLGPQLDSILSQMNPVHIVTPCYFKIVYSILPSMPRSPNSSFFLIKHLKHIQLHMRAISSAHLTLLL